MSAFGSFFTTFAAVSLGSILDRAYRKRLNAREPQDKHDLRTSLESKVLYWLAAGLMLFASLASMRAEGAWRVAAVFTVPLAGLLVFLARGAHRLRLRTLKDGFEYTGLTGQAKHVRWNEIIKVEWDGPWWAVYSTTGGRLLVSRSFVGVRYFAKDLMKCVPADSMSPFARQEWKKVLGGPA
jgi:membrane protein implicated in regulation of membrane protease activity